MRSLAGPCLVPFSDGCCAPNRRTGQGVIGRGHLSAGQVGPHGGRSHAEILGDRGDVPEFLGHGTGSVGYSLPLYSAKLYTEVGGRRTYAAWFCTEHPRGIVVAGHADDSDQRASTPGWHAEGWRMRVSADLDDVDTTLGERGWRRTTDWEPVSSGYLATVEQTSARSNEAAK
jgi:hypothetical protein